MSDTNTGATATAETQSGQQQAAQQTQQAQTATTQTAETAAATQQAVAQPSVEELQRQIKDRDDKLNLATQSAKHFQSLADQNAARLKAMAGVEPKADPLAADIQRFRDQGYDEKDARFFAGFVSEKLSAVQQRNQQLENSFGAMSNVGSAIQQAATAEPELFNNPEILAAAQNELLRAARSGAGDYVTPQYAIEFAAAEWASKNKPWKTQQSTAHAQQQTVVPQMAFLGQNGGFTPALRSAAALQQRPPGAEQADKALVDRFGITPK